MKINNFNVLSRLKTKPKILIGIGTPMVNLVILGAVSIFTTMSIVDTNKWVDHTNKVLGKAAAIVGSAVDMETGMRGYLLAGKDGFLDPYKGGQKATYESITALQQTVSDNPRQVNRLREAENILKEWQAKVTEPTIALRREIGDAKTMDDMADLVGEARGKQYFDKFRGQIATFIVREQKLLDKRRKDFGNAFDRLSASGSADAKLLKIMSDNERWVTHTYKVIAQANEILAAGVDMETGMRGYLLAGEEVFLDPYNGGQTKFTSLITGLRKTVSDNPAQVKLLTETELTIREWVKNVTEPTIALRRKIGNAKSMNDMAALVGEARGKKYFDAFRKIMAEFSAEEQGLMEARQASSASTVKFTYSAVGICIALGVLIGLALAWLIGNGIAGPIGRMTGVMGDLADGNKEIEVPDQDRKDEVGDMAQAVQVFKDNMIENDRLQAEQKEAEKKAQEEEKRRAEAERAAAAKEAEEQEHAAKEAAARTEKMEKIIGTFDTQIGNVVETLTSATTEMQSTAGSMSATADQTSKQAIAVAAASEEATTNVQTVASAAEELSSSIEEISRQVSQSNQIAQNAVNEATQTNEKVEGLADAAQKIGDVVNLINDIASQTNLLALNATIEAARAGDAGKGFAVAASEVKSLATQTAKATEQIATQISEIQSETAAAVEAIQGIGATVSQMGEIATSIASAVEEQGASTREIASSVQQAASGTQEVSSNIAQVTEAASESQASSGQMLDAAKELAKQGDVLRQEVDKFLADIRAA